MNLHAEDQIDLARACQVLAAQPFSVMLGAKVLAIDLDHAEMAVPIGANVRQHDGIAHGRLIAFLADAAVTFAAGSVCGGSVGYRGRASSEEISARF
jgi:acyl-coenzyme A thioesterase PaaI-like protein